MARVIDDRSMHQRIEQMNSLLRAKGISKNWIDAYRHLLIGDALQEGAEIKQERLYTAVGWAIHKAYGFSTVRVARGINWFDHVFYAIDKDEATWEQIMRELDDETGIVVRVSPEKDRLVLEYRGIGARRAEIEAAEFKHEHDG